MELVEIAVLVLVWLVCHSVYDWWTSRHADKGDVVVVILNGQTTSHDPGHTSLELNHNGEERDADGYPNMIEVGDLRIRAYPRIREWHSLGAVNVREGS
ncbi:MAG: hypothetical protein NZT92_07235 [Abditibacteriales bacterium]|nr:hypothetical protein [Abditibacteriales bacterium]MDW8364368.1 hypothetical protein [Abditibacteriales bacterium]